MPAVASQEEVAELVQTQEENPDLDVGELFAAAPAHLVDTEPTVEEARVEAEIASAEEEAAWRRLAHARRAAAQARQALLAARQRRDVREMRESGGAARRPGRWSDPGPR